MSYADQSKTANDPEFRARVEAAVSKEARAHTDELARAILASPATGTTWFIPFITTEPGFDGPDPSAITDGSILSATQLVWPLVYQTQFGVH